MKPSDAALGEGLAAAPCSLRFFMRRVRSARRRASIGGSQVIASQIAQKATKVAAATMTTKLFSVLARSMAGSHLDGRDLVHHEDAETHAGGGGRRHHLATLRGEQRTDVVRRDQEQAAADQERQAGHDDHGGACLGGEGADLEAQLLTGAQERAQVGQRLGEIAAGVALDRHGDDQEVELVGLHRLGDAPQRRLDRRAELHLLLDALEDAADRLLDVARDVADRLLHRQAGPQRAHDQVDRLGEQQVELAAALLGPPADPHVRQADADQQRAAQRHAGRHVEDEIEQERHRDGERDRDEGVVAQRHARPRSEQLLADRAGVGEKAPQELVEGGQPPLLLDAPQRRHLQGPRAGTRARLDVLQPVAQAPFDEEAAEHDAEGEECQAGADGDESRHHSQVDAGASHPIASISTLSRP